MGHSESFFLHVELAGGAGAGRVSVITGAVVHKKLDIFPVFIVSHRPHLFLVGTKF